MNDSTSLSTIDTHHKSANRTVFFTTLVLRHKVKIIKNHNPLF